MNLLIILEVFNVPELISNGKSFLIIATVGSILKAFKSIIVIYLDSRYLKENFVEYGLSMMKARYNWIPYMEYIGKGTMDYSHICYPSLIGTKLFGMYNSLYYEFSDRSIEEFMNNLRT